MAIPSGSGTEVLKVSYEAAGSSSGMTLATAGTHEIITILSIIFTEKGDASELMDKYIDAARNDIQGAADTNVYILYQQPIGAKQIFVWNDKFVIYGGDALKCAANSAANIDITCSYILQDWS